MSAAALTMTCWSCRPFLNCLSVLADVAFMAGQRGVIPCVRAASADWQHVFDGRSVWVDRTARATLEVHDHPAVAAVIPVDLAQGGICYAVVVFRGHHPGSADMDRLGSKRYAFVFVSLVSCAVYGTDVFGVVSLAFAHVFAALGYVLRVVPLHVSGAACLALCTVTIGSTTIRMVFRCRFTFAAELADAQSVRGVLDLMRFALQGHGGVAML